MKKVNKILIICTGNSCRSVMAEGYLKKRLKEIGLGGIAVISAGTYASNGARPTPETVKVMLENGVNVSGYLSTVVNRQLIKNAENILVMGDMHREEILNLDPEAGNKILYLRHFSGDSERKIPDPIGRDLDFYRKVFDIIKKSVEGYIKWLQE